MMIGCEILFREICLCAANSVNIVDLRFMNKGLHDIGETRMSKELQDEIDLIDQNRYEAILLGYGLCNYGVKGLCAKIPMVIPRAHDCITLMMGSKEKYKEYFFRNPGTFFKSPGWIERDANPNYTESSVTTQLGMNVNFDEYDEETAAYLRETLGSWTVNYSRYAYIDTGAGDASLYEDQLMAEAREKNWGYEKISGDVCLIQDLMDGRWDNDRFLHVPPGNRITNTFGDDIVSCEGASGD